MIRKQEPSAEVETTINTKVDVSAKRTHVDIPTKYIYWLAAFIVYSLGKDGVNAILPQRGTAATAIVTGRNDEDARKIITTLAALGQMTNMIDLVAQRQTALEVSLKQLDSSVRGLDVSVAKIQQHMDDSDRSQERYRPDVEWVPNGHGVLMPKKQ